MPDRWCCTVSACEPQAAGSAAAEYNFYTFSAETGETLHWLMLGSPGHGSRADHLNGFAMPAHRAFRGHTADVWLCLKPVAVLETSVILYAYSQTVT